jgi:hypothetical protein
MIGLEGSGFTICLGVILLLTGIVMYYCKSKITACENRMNTMLNLISDLHSEVNALKQASYVAQPVAATSMPVTEYAETTEFVAENEHDSESEEEDDSEDEEGEEITLEKAVNPFETHPYKELIPSNSTVGADVINESSESEGDTDDETPKQEVKVVELGQIEELEIDDLDEEDEEVEESSEEETQIDYAKMQVTALKKLAAERQLAPNVHKLRKQELVNLLQSH